MPIFSRHQNKLTSINELNPKSYKESDLQRLAEANLEAVFGLIFVTTEFQLNGLRVDTLAFDAEAKAFVIIEYKRDHSFSVVDQGYAYLSLMLNHKADFILEYNEHMSKHLGKTDVDWSQSRVIFVANSFTTYQQQAINFRDLPMELWEAKYYSNDTVLFNRLKTPDSSESINTISKKSQTINEVSKEVKKYTVADHFTGAKAEWLPIYEELCDRLMMIDERIKENPRSGHIGLALDEKAASTVIDIKPHNQDSISAVVRTEKDKKENTCVEIAQFVHDLKKSGKIEDYNQVAFLFPSLKSEGQKSTKVVEFEKALNNLGIQIYAPRAGRFLEVPEAVQIFGLMFTILGRQRHQGQGSAGLRDFRSWQLHCIDEAEKIIANDSLLKEYIKDRTNELEFIKNDYEALMKIVNKNKGNIKGKLKLDMVQALASAPGLSSKCKATIQKQAVISILRKS